MPKFYGNQCRVYLYLTGHQFAKLEVEAKKQRRSPSQLARLFVEDGLAKLPAEKQESV